jgi:hypothetical protein
MSQSSCQESVPKAPSDLTNKIKELLQFQRFAVSRASFIEMSRDEAAEMQARINQIEKPARPASWI